MFIVNRPDMADVIAQVLAYIAFGFSVMGLQHATSQYGRRSSVLTSLHGLALSVELETGHPSRVVALSRWPGNIRSWVRSSACGAQFR